MGGPIVRSYGVPNWDEIFGKKESGGKAADAEKPSKKPPAAAKAGTGAKAKTAKARSGGKKK